MTVFAPSLAGLWHQLEESGIDPEPLFKREGLSKDIRFDPDGRVPKSKVDRIDAAAFELCSDPFYGIHKANYFLPSHLGALGFAWLASAHLEDALHRLQRYAHMIASGLEIQLGLEGSELLVTVSETSSLPDQCQINESNLAVLTKMCRFLRGDSWNPSRVLLPSPEPTDTSEYFAYFRCPVEFNSASASLALHADSLLQRADGANAHLAQMNDHIVVRYLAHLSKEDILNRTRAAIIDRLGDGGATEQEVAKQLGLSSRQLNRRLQQQDTSFRALLTDCRRELAAQYVHDSTLSLTEIAFMLGFAESSSFSRAYRRWTGQSPSQARAG